MKRFRAAVAWLGLTIASGAVAAPFTGITLLGDSLTDNGNAYLALSAVVGPDNAVTQPPYELVPSAPYERPAPLLPALSNGPVWAEFLGQALNLPVVPSFAPTTGGSNFAVAGADTGPLPGIPASLIPTLELQFNQLSLLSGGTFSPTELFGVWGGANDIRRALDVYQQTILTGGSDDDAFQAAIGVVTAGVENIAGILEGLVQGGAKYILSLNVPDIGLTPEVAQFSPSGAVDLARNLSIAFNTGLASVIDAIELASGLDIIEVDVFATLSQVVAAPSVFGFSNVTDPCIDVGGSSTCANPDEYLFWDGLHPTSAAHRLLAAAVLGALPLPLPGTEALLLIGVIAMVRYGRRRAT